MDRTTELLRNVRWKPPVTPGLSLSGADDDGHLHALLSKFVLDIELPLALSPGRPRSRKATSWIIIPSILSSDFSGTSQQVSGRWGSLKLYNRKRFAE
jgi:hypothetical protein